MNFKNKTILITGASSGIGHELAKQLAEKGAHLLLLARRKSLLEELTASLPDNKNHSCFTCDVTNHQQVKEICSRIKDTKPQIDVMFLNAGIVKDTELNPFSLNTIRQEMETNFFGAVYFVEQFLPDMLAKNKGLIVATSSLAAYSGLPKAEASSASKSALLRFMESLQIDLIKTGVNATVLTPGFIKSPITDNFDFKLPVVVPTEKAVKKIIRQLEKGRTKISFPFILRFSTFLVSLLPHTLKIWILSKTR